MRKLLAAVLAAGISALILLPAGAAGAPRAHRYPVGDGKGRSVAISVTAACRASCRSANPRRIASFLGTLAHGSEMSLLKVELDTPSQIASDCGRGSQACYFSAASRMLINGNDAAAHDGATREFVVAHEYGHHLAQHRPAPPPGSAAIDWGAPRWATYEHICRGKRSGRYFPGSQRGRRYFQNPGEAFAEVFAFNRFPGAPVHWSWSASLKPGPGAFAAIRADVSSPWQGMRSLGYGRRLNGGGSATHSFSTPLDGSITLRLRGPHASRFELRLLDPAGHLLASSAGRRPGATLRYDVCGQRRLRAVVRRTAPGSGGYRLTIRTP